MVNWLADPVACAVRLKTERGCNVLMARSEVLSRATRCVRTEKHDGVYWRWGHLWTRRSESEGVQITLGDDYEDSLSFSTEHANVASDLLRAAYVNAGSGDCGGKTILEMLWAELDAVMDRLMSEPAEDGRDPGRAEGVAYCIAVMQNPYLPNIDAVRDQAMDRWEQQQAAPAPPAPAKDRAAMRRARRARHG